MARVSFRRLRRSCPRKAFGVVASLAQDHPHWLSRRSSIDHVAGTISRQRASPGSHRGRKRRKFQIVPVRVRDVLGRGPRRALEESGEVWMSDGVAFTEHKGQKHISYGHLFSNWIRGLANGMACLDALGASERSRIVMGIDGMSDAVWPMQSGHMPARSRKSGLLVDETERD